MPSGRLFVWRGRDSDPLRPHRADRWRILPDTGRLQVAQFEHRTIPAAGIRSRRRRIRVKWPAGSVRCACGEGIVVTELLISSGQRMRCSTPREGNITCVKVLDWNHERIS